MTDADDLSELERLLAEPSARAVMRAFMRVTPSLTAVVRAPDLKVLFVSAFGAQLIGRLPADMQGIPFEEWSQAARVFWPDGREIAHDERLLVRATCGETVLGQEAYLLDGAGEKVPILCNCAPIHDADGEVLGGVVVCSDVRKLKALEGELRVAYRELVHRVKNHLQMMSSVIALDARDPNLTAAELAELNQGRLQMLAAVYDGMVQAEAGQCIAAAAFVDLVCRPYRSATVAIEITIEPADLTLEPDRAAPFGMLVNEAVCNSYKHAFPDRSGTVRVELRREGPDRLALQIDDDGVGLPPGPPRDRSHGLLLMRLQAEKLGASFELGPRPGGGTRMRAVMPG
ncbi:sensor histidine kinase [Caulobacter sp. 17J80-11]|uniref:sensor histidine kinase n=1 Tax=Caulobacter sp. 17J80-11 TaxID=2763502 RepID=UPI001653DBD8|nr:PAS domain-containing sensor histidine kinase [Caulobacter sp. 17J80-11]MBC6981360.1 PAS domain-containing protein [Caulobacter sp. 17J80-11]